METVDIVIMGERVGHDPKIFNVTRFVLVAPGTEPDKLKESEYGRRADFIVVVSGACVLKNQP